MAGFPGRRRAHRDGQSGHRRGKHRPGPRGFDALRLVTHERMAPVRLAGQRDGQPGRSRAHTAQHRVVTAIEDRDGRLATRGQARWRTVHAGVVVVRTDGEWRQQLVAATTSPSCQVMSMPWRPVRTSPPRSVRATMPIAVPADVSRATPSRARAVNPAGPAHEIACGAIASAIKLVCTHVLDYRSQRRSQRPLDDAVAKFLHAGDHRSDREDVAHRTRRRRQASGRPRAPSRLLPGAAGATGRRRRWSPGPRATSPRRLALLPACRAARGRARRSRDARAAAAPPSPGRMPSRGVAGAGR